jgi:hypothetical protein
MKIKVEAIRKLRDILIKKGELEEDDVYYFRNNIIDLLDKYLLGTLFNNYIFYNDLDLIDDDNSCNLIIPDKIFNDLAELCTQKFSRPNRQYLLVRCFGKDIDNGEFEVFPSDIKDIFKRIIYAYYANEYDFDMRNYFED